MEIVDPEELISGFRRVDLRGASSLELRGVLDDIRIVRARFDLVEAAVAYRLIGVTGTPERDVAQGAQRSNRHGARVVARASTLAAQPALSAALDKGALGGEHVDAFAKVLATLDGPVKSGLTEAAPELIEAAASSGSTPEEFAASLTATAEKIAADGGTGRFERQRRATRLRTWTDRATGMFRLSGAFDPESGALLHGRFEAAMAAMFATKTPSTAPSDPGEKQDHLRAIALLALTAGHFTANVSSGSVDGDQACEMGQTVGTNNHAVATDPSGPTGGTRSHSGPTDRTGPANPSNPGDDEWDTFSASWRAVRRFGRPEITVVIDTNSLDQNGDPTVDWGIPVAVPWERIQNLCRNASVRPVILHKGAVIDADGDLNLGRSTRLANRAQRRALRAIYATCAVPGCTVGFSYTKPHHVHWWRHGGPTDLANLLPLCSKHHHLAHEGRWLLTLSPDRELTITLPDGQIMRTGPPSRSAAA